MAVKRISKILLLRIQTGNGKTGNGKYHKKIEELSDKIKLLEASIASVNKKIKTVSAIEQANKDTKDKLDSIEKKVDHNTKQAVKVNEEKVKPIEKKSMSIICENRAT